MHSLTLPIYSAAFFSIASFPR